MSFSARMRGPNGAAPEIGGNSVKGILGRHLFAFVGESKPAPWARIHDCEVIPQPRISAFLSCSGSSRRAAMRLAISAGDAASKRPRGVLVIAVRSFGAGR